jgi:hypothetical protein
MHLSTIRTVDAPGRFANSSLNGSECVVVHDGGAFLWSFVTVLLLSGPESGREWQISRDHLRPVA